MPGRDIQDPTQAELEAWCVEQGEAPYRARQVLTWVHRRGVTRFEEMANLPKLLRVRLMEAFEAGRMDPATVAESADGTRKLLFQLASDPPAPGRAAAIESVLIPQVERP